MGYGVNGTLPTSRDILICIDRDDLVGLNAHTVRVVERRIRLCELGGRKGDGRPLLDFRGKDVEAIDTEDIHLEGNADGGAKRTGSVESRERARRLSGDEGVKGRAVLRQPPTHAEALAA